MRNAGTAAALTGLGAAGRLRGTHRASPGAHDRNSERETMDTTARDQLRQMLLQRSMRFGEFILSSGATSNYYVDVRKTSLHPVGLRWISKMFYDALQADNVTAVGGLTLGADPLVAGVMLYSLEAGKPLDGFLVRRT